MSTNMNEFSLSQYIDKKERKTIFMSVKYQAKSLIRVPAAFIETEFQGIHTLIIVLCSVGDYNFVFHFHYFNALSSFVLQCFSVGIRILQTGQEKKEKFKIWIFLWQDFQYAGWVWTCVVFENWRTIFKMLEWVSECVCACVCRVHDIHKNLVYDGSEPIHFRTSDKGREKERKRK